MKSRTFWAFVALTVLVIGAAYWWRQRPHQPPTSGAPVGVGAAATKKQKAEVAIQDGKTIDFSSGLPIVKDDAKQKAAIEKSVKEMELAAKGVTFPPKAPGEKKPADSLPAKP